jgi:hypothetical protein
MIDTARGNLNISMTAVLVGALCVQCGLAYSNESSTVYRTHLEDGREATVTCTKTLRDDTSVARYVLSVSSTSGDSSSEVWRHSFGEPVDAPIHNFAFHSVAGVGAGFALIYSDRHTVLVQVAMISPGKYRTRQEQVLAKHGSLARVRAASLASVGEVMYALVSYRPGGLRVWQIGEKPKLLYVEEPWDFN